MNNETDSPPKYYDYYIERNEYIYPDKSINFVYEEQAFCTFANSNIITNPYYVYKDRLYEPFWKWFIIIIYSGIMLTSVFSNLAIVVAYFASKRTRNVCSLLLVALCFADLGQVLVTTPMQLYMIIMPWTLGAGMCKLMLTLFGLPLYTSILLVALIALDRYRKICCADSWQLNERRTLLYIAGAIVFSLVIALPVFIAADYNENFGLCIENYGADLYHLRFAYTVTIFVVQFFLPLAFISAVYLKIFTYISNKEQRKQRMNMTRLHTILLMHTATFALLWTPHQLYGLFYEINATYSILPNSWGTIIECEMRVIDLCFKAFALLSTIVHPIMYGVLNKKIYAELKTNWKSAAVKFTTIMPKIDARRPTGWTRAGAAASKDERVVSETQALKKGGGATMVQRYRQQHHRLSAPTMWPVYGGGGTTSPLLTQMTALQREKCAKMLGARASHSSDASIQLNCSPAILYKLTLQQSGISSNSDTAGLTEKLAGCDISSSFSSQYRSSRDSTGGKSSNVYL